MVAATVAPPVEAVDHRPWETAILSTMSDGKAHSRAELHAAAARLVDPLLAIRAARKTEQSKGEKARAAVANDVVNGTQVILSKAISYMETRRLIEPVDYDDKGHRSAFKITDQGQAYLKHTPTKKPYALIETDPEWAAATNGDTPVPIALCSECGEEVDPAAVGVWSQRLGWTQRRAKGGANRLARQSQPIAYAHEGCLS